MKKGETKDCVTVTVTGSQSLARPDGLAAIRLLTKELGPLAFEVDQRAIDALRRSLALAETHLRHSAATTKN